MAIFQTVPEKRFAVARLDRMLGRVYSIALLAITTEALVNGFREIDRLNQLVFFVSVGLFGISVLGVIISHWFFKDGIGWLRAVAILTAIGLFTWPLHFDPVFATENFQPWIWWTLGIAMVAGGTSFPAFVSLAYLIAIPTGWFLLKISPYGGSDSVIDSLQDSLHLFLFPTILVAMVTALRWEGAKVDRANQLAIDSAVESARVDALELERSRLDALVHDSVLTTPLVASRARDEEHIEAAAKSARLAIASLDNALSGEIQQENMTLASVFNSIELSLAESDQQVTVSSERSSDLQIPPNVASALIEATLQVVDNSVKHAPNATSREVRLRGQQFGLKIVISDDGPGFRVNQVPKDRLGLRESIIGRVEKVGGKVFLNTKPGGGTTVVIEWSATE
ncbi:MAG: sensor histidine kinase [Actinomycetota bacterium]